MLNTNALTTVARLCDFMGIAVPSSTAKLEAQINAVSNFVQQQTGVTFKKTTYTRELYSVEKGQYINLKHYPVVDTEPIIIERRNSALNENNWEVLDGLYYNIDYDTGIIEAMGGSYFFRGQHNYRITYTAGYNFDNSTTFLGDTEASDVELAVWLLCQDLYNSTGVNNNIKSEKIGDYQIVYNNMQGTLFSNPQAMSILSSYGGLDMGGVLTPFQSL